MREFTKIEIRSESWPAIDTLVFSEKAHNSLLEQLYIQKGWFPPFGEKDDLRVEEKT